MSGCAGLPLWPEVVELEAAQLCQDCSAITAAQNGRCLRCGSRALLALASVLNRKTEEAHDEVF
jgi:uncharacterized paraquat-inducible protein A